MKSLTINLTDRLHQSLEIYLQDQSIPCSPDDIIQSLLEEFLSSQGYLTKPRKHLKITPAPKGSGYTDTSINHDRVLTSEPK